MRQQLAAAPEPVFEQIIVARLAGPAAWCRSTGPRLAHVRLGADDRCVIEVVEAPRWELALDAAALDVRRARSVSEHSARFVLGRREADERWAEVWGARLAFAAEVA